VIAQAADNVQQQLVAAYDHISEVLQEALTSAGDLNAVQREVIDDHLRQSRWALVQARNFSRPDRLSRLMRFADKDSTRGSTSLSTRTSAGSESESEAPQTFYPQSRAIPKGPQRSQTMPRLTPTGQLESFSKLNLGKSDGQLFQAVRRRSIMQKAMQRWFKPV